MTPSPWPGVGMPPFDPAPRPFGSGAGDVTPGARAPWTAPPAGDAIRSAWWSNPPVPGPGAAASPADAFAFVQSVVASLAQLVASLFANHGDDAHEGGPQRAFGDADFSSTGDPHLAESGTYADGSQAAAHRDSMTAHDDLLHSTSIDGGYRVSTAVTQPNAQGITWNQSATVHADGDQDRVTMAAGGGIAITDHGAAVSIAKGQSITLSGGEMVTENEDGSLAVTATNAQGGSISTTLRANGNGVDVTTHAHAVDVGGDIVDAGADPAPAPTPPPLAEHHRRLVGVREVA